MALFQWIELLTGKPLLFLDEFPGKACFRHLLMGTGFRGFLGDYLHSNYMVITV